MSFANLFLSLLLVFDFDAISCARVRILNVERRLYDQATEHENSGGLHDLQRESAVASASPSVKHAASIAHADLRRRWTSSSFVDHLHEEEEAVPHLSRAFVELQKSTHLALTSLGTSRMKLYMGASSTLAFVVLVVCVCCCLSAGLRQSSADSESDEVGSEENTGRRRLAKSKHSGSGASTPPVLGPALVVTSIKAVKQMVKQDFKETASRGSDSRGGVKEYRFGDLTRGLAAAGREAQGKDANGKLKIGDVARGLLAKTRRHRSTSPEFLTPPCASTASRTRSYRGGNQELQRTRTRSL